MCAAGLYIQSQVNLGSALLSESDFILPRFPSEAEDILRFWQSFTG
jgi:hypothetical protein